jgi:two-component system, OmpR family, phosphate regulon response regulator PhoB
VHGPLGPGLIRPSPAGRVARAGPNRPGSRGMDLVMSAKILVVDDEPDALELIEFNLKPAGFEVLTILAQSRGRGQTREQLLRDVWEYDSSIETRTVDTHVHRLRDKLGRAAPALVAVRGLGGGGPSFQVSSTRRR